MTAAEAVEKCAALVEKLAKSCEADAVNSTNAGALDVARLERAEARALRSAARLMREHVK
jgi:hypothetical protein